MLSYFLIAGIGFGIAYWITSSGLSYWRAIAGFAVAFPVAWIAGPLLSVFFLSTIDGIDKLVTLELIFFRGFLWAVTGAGYGVYRGRSGLKKKLIAAPEQSTTQEHPRIRTGNDAYAAALAEIEEGRLDKGGWARAFAEAGGDEPKAKALYIKARAGAAKNAVVWEDTQPPVGNDNGIKIATAEQSAFKGPPPRNSPMSAIVAFSLVGVVVIGGILAAFVLPVNQDKTKQQTFEAPPVQAPTTQAEWEKGVITPPPSNPFSEAQAQDANARQAAQPSQIEEFLNAAPNAPSARQAATPSLVPFNGKLDDAPRDARSVSEQKAPSEAEKEHYRRIYAAHPDADQIAGTAAFQAWVARRPEYQRILKAGTAHEIVSLFSTYKKQSQVQGAAGASPAAFYKCNGPNGVLYQATPCGTASN